MAVTKNKPGFQHGAGSKMANQKYVTKPENRHPTTHTRSVGQALGVIKKLGG